MACSDTVKTRVCMSWVEWGWEFFKKKRKKKGENANRKNT